MLYWQSRLEQGRRNRRGAEALKEAEEFGLACFSCQQAAEMGLKAALESRALERSGHNLLELTRQLEASTVVVSPEVWSAVRRLNRLYIPTRYPDAVGGGVPADNYVREDADQSLRDADCIIAFAESAVSREN